ncbi:putative DNA repair endonuclease [Plasmodium gaboni]|uniref:Putative DNA repair endonuclease n=1 Tax=Plasmodium gaboni TaxID=647221 RepID=A0A151LER1_9APIC|nr:putative DNA repair endonuclease [Plasmodium gaboni]KYN97443.1 putative DNA repair endonuclease [Plasmodium gaboni]
MYPLYYEKKIVKKLIEQDSLIILADGFNELNILAIFIFYYQNRCLWNEQDIYNDNIFFDLFNLNKYNKTYEKEVVELIEDDGQANVNNQTTTKYTVNKNKAQNDNEIEYYIDDTDNSDKSDKSHKSNKSNKSDKDAIPTSCRHIIDNMFDSYKYKEKNNELQKNDNQIILLDDHEEKEKAETKKNDNDNNNNNNNIDSYNNVFNIFKSQNNNLKDMCTPNKLIFILNVTPKEYNIFLKYQLSLYEQINEIDERYNDKVKINYFKTEYIRDQKSHERIEMYIKRGVYFISSNVLLIDLLTFKIIPEIIDGIFICKNHRLIYNMKEIFIIELYRKRNKFGFIKGISNNKKLINHQHIVNLAQKLYMKRIYCYPRFHKHIHISLNNKFLQPHIYEINLDMPTILLKIEENILNILHYLNLEIKKNYNFHDFDLNPLLYSENPESYVLSYIKTKTLNYNTKKLLKEIITLVNMLCNLFIYDSLIFYNYLNNLKEADKECIWLYCNEANEIFYLSRERKDFFLNKMNILVDPNDMNTINNTQNIINVIQYDNNYFHKSYQVKKEFNQLYNWVYELVFNRDIEKDQYEKIREQKERIKNKNIMKRKFILNKKKKNKQSNTKHVKDNIHTEHITSIISNNDVNMKHSKNSNSNNNSNSRNNSNSSNNSNITIKNNKRRKIINSNNFNHNNNNMYNLIKKEKDDIIQIKSSDSEINNINNNNSIIKSNEHIIFNDHKECKNEIDKINVGQSNDNNNNNNNIIKMCTNQRKINEHMDKIEYPIVIIVDNFYMQKEFYNLLLHTNDDKEGRKRDNNENKSKDKDEEKIINPNNNNNNNNNNYNVDDNTQQCQKHFNVLIKAEKENKITDIYITDDSVSSDESYNNNNKKNLNTSNNSDIFCLQNNPFNIPYDMIKNKTHNLKYIKPHIYILCINKNYENIYAKDNFVQTFHQKIDAIHKKRDKENNIEGEIKLNEQNKMDETCKKKKKKKDKEKNKNNQNEQEKNDKKYIISNDEHLEDDNFFEINEYCGNLDFLEIFLITIKPYRIILTTLDLNIFRNIEIYCARLFQYSIYQLHEEQYFKDIMKYEKDNFIYVKQNENNINKTDHIIKQNDNKQNHNNNNNNKRYMDNNNNYYNYNNINKNTTYNNKYQNNFIKTEMNHDQNKLRDKKKRPKKKQNGSIKQPIDIFTKLKIWNDMCNSVEVFLIFFKNNIHYNKYLNKVKVEKSNWITFLENRNNLRFELDRNVFNKNEELFKKVINSYLNFQKRFKDNKKNITNFNQSLCDEFKSFQDVKIDEYAIENNNVLLDNHYNNFISMEEEEIFIKNYQNKMNKNISSFTFDEKIIQKIQEILQKFSIDSFNLNFILYSIFNNTKPIVIVDIRELKSDLTYKLYKSKMHIIPYSLLVGDYILTKDICVERKSIIDLIQSLNNNRLYNQINQMSKYYQTYVLLIEFNNKNLFYFASLNDKNSVYTKLIMICIQFPKLKILWSPFSLFTVKLFWSLKVNASQPDIFKSLHIDMTLQKTVREQYIMSKNKINKGKDVTNHQNSSKDKKEIRDEEKQENNNNTKIDELVVQTNDHLHVQTNDHLHVQTNDHLHVQTNDEDNVDNKQETYKYETIYDLFDKNLYNLQNIEDDDKDIKKVQNVTNWNAIEILKSLPGVTEKNMHYLINNINSLRDLCDQTLEQLENYMSKSNAKLLYDFLNENIS